MKTGGSLSKLVTLFLKFIIKSLIHSKLVNFFLAVIWPSRAHSKNINFIGWKCPNLKGDGYRDTVGKNVILFSKASLISLIFLWVVKHFIVVIYCILNLTNSLGKIGRGLETNSTFKLIFYKASQSES